MKPGTMIRNLVVGILLSAASFPATFVLALVYMPRLKSLGEYAGVGYLAWTWIVAVCTPAVVLLASLSALESRGRSVFSRAGLAFLALHALNCAYLWFDALFRTHPPGTI
jgi:hypothetical protein